MPDYPALERYEQVLTTEGFHSINQAVFLADGMRDEYEARLNTKDDRIEALEAELEVERGKRRKYERIFRLVWERLSEIPGDMAFDIEDIQSGEGATDE